MPTDGQHASIPPDILDGRHHSSGGGMHACHNCAFLHTCADIAGSRSRVPPLPTTRMRRTSPACHTGFCACPSFTQANVRQHVIPTGQSRLLLHCHEETLTHCYRPADLRASANMAALRATVQAALQDAVAGCPAGGRGVLATEPFHSRLQCRLRYKSAVCTTSHVQHCNRVCWRSETTHQRTLPHPQARGPDRGQLSQDPAWHSCGHSEDNSLDRLHSHSMQQGCLQWQLDSNQTARHMPTLLQVWWPQSCKRPHGPQ
jgi:hypothetical protein